MRILAIDTALAACSVAIADDTRILARRWEAMPRGQAERLLPMLEEARGEAAVAYDSLDLILVTVGPGTFTGVRVGLSAARGLALACDCPVHGVGTLAALACAVTEPGPVLAGIDARRNELYWQAFADDGAPVGEPRLDSYDEIVEPRTAPGHIVGSARSTLTRRLPGWALSAAPELPDAAMIAVNRHRFGALTPGTRPSPLYLRAPDAKLPQA